MQDSESPDISRPQRNGLILGVACVGVVLRLYLPFFGTDSLVNDGGLHLRFVDALISNGFRLPAFVDYNQLSIPFAYPPLSTYATAFLSVIFGADVETTLRFLPAIISCFSIFAFFLLSKEVLERYWQQFVAVAVFSFIPSAFCQLIKSGGISRSLGALFCILAIREVVKIGAGQRGNKIFLKAALLVALTELSHPEWAFGLLLVFIAQIICVPKTLRPLLQTLLVSKIATAPWWITILLVHGTAPFAAAAQTNSLPWDFASLISLTIFLPIITNLALPILGLMGLFASLMERKFLFPLLTLFMALFQGRGSLWILPIPLSIFVAVGVAWLFRFIFSLPDTVTGGFFRRELRPRVMRGVVCLCVAYALADGVWLLASDMPEVRSATPAIEESFEWVHNNTKPSSKFLVLTGMIWWMDYVNELFPALTDRSSVSTCQGSEWLPGGAFAKCLELVSKLQSPFSPANAELVEQTVRRNDIDYIFALKSSFSPRSMGSFLGYDYHAVFENSDAVIFEHRSFSQGGEVLSGGSTS